MDKKIIHGVEVSDVKVDLNFCMDGAYPTPRVLFKMNGFLTLEWLKKADDGSFWVERRVIWGSHEDRVALVKITTGLDEDVCDEFLDELHDYLDDVVCEQTQEAMSTDINCFELRFCEYGRMPQVGCTGSVFDTCVSCAQELEELEFYMREQSPLRRERYYIAQCVTHEVLKIF